MSDAPAAVLQDLGGNGPPVLLIHGFGADRFGWAANAHALMAGHRVFAVDLPGHGAAGNAVGDGTPGTLAAAVAGVIDHLPGPLPVVAHSLGAAVALQLAQALPGRIGPMVLIAPAGLGASLDADFLTGFARIASAEVAEGLLSRLVEKPRLIAPMVPHVLAALGQPGRRAALDRIAAALLRVDPPPLPADVTLVWGECDRIVPPPADTVQGVMPRIVPGAGHLPHVEAAGRVNRIIAAALAGPA